MRTAAGWLVATLVAMSLTGAAAAQEFCDADKAEYDQSRVNARLETKLYSLFACRSDLPPGSTDQNDVTACNWFVGQALAEFWERNEFFLAPAGRYMITAELAAITPEGWAKMGWTELGLANDQEALTKAEEAAYEGNAVIALRSGHVALVLPGGLAASGSWNLNVPRAAQLKINDIDHAFIGCKLSRSWQTTEYGGVHLLSAPRN